MALLVDLRTLLQQTWPGRFDADQLTAQSPLGEDGLGLDSVEVAEILIACEEMTGRAIDEHLLTTGVLTVERVERHFADR